MKVGDYGMEMVIDTQADLSAVTDLQVKGVRPDGSTFTHDLGTSTIQAAIPPSTRRTAVGYVVQAGDLTLPGIYQLEIVNASSNVRLTTNAVEIYVGPGL